ncbi:MAG: MarR family transcriptional regulator [Alphaproteobacteria bacterium]
MDRVEDCISFLVGKAAQQITKRARDKLAPHRVTPVQYAALKVLWERDGLSSADLGGRLMLDSATMTGVIDRLETASLIERRSDPEDRRVHRLFLTEQGKALQAPLDAAMDELNAEARTAAGGEMDALSRALRNLNDLSRWR